MQLMITEVGNLTENPRWLN